MIKIRFDMGNPSYFFSRLSSILTRSASFEVAPSLLSAAFLGIWRKKDS
jgi:hypothetical protein